MSMARLYAEREQGAFYGLGYASGEDRLDQVLTLFMSLCAASFRRRFGSKTPTLPGDFDVRRQCPGPFSDAVATTSPPADFSCWKQRGRAFLTCRRPMTRDLQGCVADLHHLCAGALRAGTKIVAHAFGPTLWRLLHILSSMKPAHVFEARRARDGKSPQRSMRIGGPQRRRRPAAERMGRSGRRRPTADHFRIRSAPINQ